MKTPNIDRKIGFSQIYEDTLGLSREELFQKIIPNVDFNHYPNVAAWCLASFDPKAFELFKMTHEAHNDYSNTENFNFLSAIYNKPFSTIGESCSEFLDNAQEFLGYAIKEGFIPDDNIVFLKSSEGQQWLEKLIEQNTQKEYEREMRKEGLHKAATPRILELGANKFYLNYKTYDKILTCVERNLLARQVPRQENSKDTPKNTRKI